MVILDRSGHVLSFGLNLKNERFVTYQELLTPLTHFLDFLNFVSFRKEVTHSNG